MNSETLTSLIQRHLDGAATPEETSRLALALTDDPAAARAYAQATRLDAGLRATFEAEAVGRRLTEAARSVQPSARAAVGWAAVGWQRAGAAAAAVVMAGLALWWWRMGARPSSSAVVSAPPVAEPKRVVEVAGPPPVLRRPGELSAAARELKRLASRYWLPDPIELTGLPLSEAVALVQQRVASANHRKNPMIAQFAIDLPEEVADAPVTASRGELPLHAWLELLSSQVGCDLRYTETGVTFDPVDQPDRLESRQFEVPTVADASAPADAPAPPDAGAAAGAPARLFSYAHPWEAAPDFRSVPPHASALASAWRIPLSGPARLTVRDEGRLEARHSRRELRRIEGLLAVAAADAGRPAVTFRAQEVLLPAPASAGVTGDFDAGLAAITDQNLVELYITPQVVEFEGFINYGEPMVTRAVDANGQPTEIVLTESRIEQPVFASRAYAAAGSRVVENDEAVGLLAQASEGGSTSRPLSWSQRLGIPLLSTVNRSIVTYDAGSTFNLNLDAERLTRAAEAQGETVVESEPPPDPWQQAAKATVKLGEQAWLSTSVGPPITLGEEGTMVVGFDLAVSPPPPLNATARLEGEMVKMSGTFAPPAGSGAPTDFEAHVGPGQALVLQTQDAPAAQGGNAYNSDFIVTRDDYSFALPVQMTAEEAESVQSEESHGEMKIDITTAFQVATEYAVAENGRVASDAGAGGSAGQVHWSFSVPAETRWGDSLGRALTRSGPDFVHGVVISPVIEWP